MLIRPYFFLALSEPEIFETDASEAGWGAFMGHQNCSGHWKLSTFCKYIQAGVCISLESAQETSNLRGFQHTGTSGK